MEVVCRLPSLIRIPPWNGNTNRQNLNSKNLLSVIHRHWRGACNSVLSKDIQTLILKDLLTTKLHLMMSERFSTYSHPLIALTPKKFKDVSNANRLFWSRRAWCGRRGPTLCNCAAFRSQWQSVVGRSLSMTSYNHPTDFFFFLNFKNYGSDGRLLSSLPSQMIRKRLKLDNSCLFDYPIAHYM